MLKKIIFCSLFLAIGCASQQPKAPTQISDPIKVRAEEEKTLTAQAPKIVDKRSDLPEGWFEVKGDNYSFGLPQSFEKRDAGSVQVSYKSETPKMMVLFSTDKTDLNLKDYTQAIVDKMTSGALPIRLIDSQAGKVAGKDAIMALLVAPGVVAAHFVVVDAGNAFNLTCMTTIDQANENASKCFDIVRTLKLK